MRIALFAFASLLCSASAARAEVDRDEPPAAPRDSELGSRERPQTYVASGLTVGSVESHTALGVSVDVGVHAVGPLWVHAGADAGADGAIFGGSGSYRALYGGAELSSCHRGDRTCVFVGADLGFAHSQYSDVWQFGDMTYGSAQGHDGMVGVARAGFDLGGKVLRWRPGVEVSFGDVSSAAMTQSVALQF